MSGYDPADPATWPPKTQVGFMGGSLKDFLAEVPTAGDVGQGAGVLLSPEELAAKAARAQRIAGSIDAVYKVMDESQ